MFNSGQTKVPGNDLLCDFVASLQGLTRWKMGRSQVFWLNHLKVAQQKDTLAKFTVSCWLWHFCGHLSISSMA